jgi:hypothetical protein
VWDAARDDGGMIGKLGIAVLMIAWFLVAALMR